MFNFSFKIFEEQLNKSIPKYWYLLCMKNYIFGLNIIEIFMVYIIKENIHLAKWPTGLVWFILYHYLFAIINSDNLVSNYN
jgi:hypothetical protein